MGWKKNFLSRSFSGRLTFLILLVAVSVFVAAFILYYNTACRIVEKKAVRQAETALSLTVLQVDKVLESVEDAVGNIAWMVPRHLKNKQDLYDITKHLVEKNPFISGSAIAFEPNYFSKKGYYYAPFAYRDGKTIQMKQLGNDEYQYHQMEWYEIPSSTGKVHWSEPYFDKGGGNMMMTTFSVPLYDGHGVFFGVFTADVSLHWLTAALNKLQLYESSYTIMMGRNGVFISHPEEEKILRDSIAGAPIGPSVWNLQQVAQEMLSGECGMYDADKGEEPSYIFYAPVSRVGWTIAVVCPKDDIFGPVNDMRRWVIYITLAGLLLMTLLCFYVIRNVTDPLQKFAASAMGIAEGDFHSRLPVIHTRDEMRTLHDSFEYMQTSLVRHMEELEKATARRERMESELRIANTIQMEMLPKDFPAFPERRDIGLYAQLIPAKEVGGDLYDYFLQEDLLYFCIGDVSGKGVPASLIMSVICHAFQTVSRYILNPSDIVSFLNGVLVERNVSCMFCTFFMGILDLKTGRLRYCNAGHNAPVLISSSPAGTSLAEPIPVLPNVPLGLAGDFHFEEQKMLLSEDHTLFLYTDGVTEAMNEAKEEYSEERLIRQLGVSADDSPEEMVKDILKDVKDYAGKAAQSDDITILCLNRRKNRKMQLTLENKIPEITRLGEFVNTLGQVFSLSEEQQFQINLALEEVITNIILYAYPKEEEHSFSLNVSQDGALLRFTVIDDGRPFDPTAVPPAEVNLPPESRKIGGLGIFLAREMMDDVFYRRVGDRNELTLIKKI